MKNKPRYCGDPRKETKHPDTGDTDEELVRFADGGVVAWGAPGCGGDASAVRDHLQVGLAWGDRGRLHRGRFWEVVFAKTYLAKDEKNKLIRTKNPLHFFSRVLS